MARFATGAGDFSVVLSVHIGSGVHRDFYYNGQRWLFLRKVNRWILETGHSLSTMASVMKNLNYNYTSPSICLHCVHRDNFFSLQNFTQLLGVSSFRRCLFFFFDGKDTVRKFHCFTVHFVSLNFIHTNSCTFSYNHDGLIILFKYFNSF